MIKEIKLETLRDKVQRCIHNYLEIADNYHLEFGIYYYGQLFRYSNNEQKHLYDIGSLSKTFTAHLILKLIDNKQLDINDNIGKYLNLPNGYYPTIYELLTHTAGYNNLTPVEITIKGLLKHRYISHNPYDNCTEEDIIKALIKRNKKKAINRYGYSDFSYAILAIIIEKITKKTFLHAMEEFIKIDLAMQKTTFFADNRKIMAVNKNKRYNYWHWNTDNPYLASGGLISDINDMLQYLKTQIESEESFITNAHKIQKIKSKSNITMAFGWHSYQNSRQLWHVGGVGTFRSSLIFNKKKNFGVVVLGNAKGIKSANVHYLAKMLYSEIKINKFKGDNTNGINNN